MTNLHQVSISGSARIGAAVAAFCLLAHSAAADDVATHLARLAEQNAALLQLAQEQQAQIAALQQRIERIEREGQRQQIAIQTLQQTDTTPARPETTRPPAAKRIEISGDTGLAFFAGQKNNEFPNDEFRVDTARIHFEAAISPNIFAVSSLELFRRESNQEAVEVGSLFVDFENLFALADHDNLFNLRVGRFEIPFGQEYLNRYAMENPLVSHSVSDIMGIDQGIKLFGDADRFSYALAIQNGSASLLRDFDADKSVTLRLGYQATEALSLFASLMRTGDLDAARDQRSEIWIGNVRFLPIGSAQTTTFDAQLAQIDLAYKWDNGSLAAAYGNAWYDDNDPLGDNSRDFKFYHLEARQNLTDKLYAAARFSELSVDDGYPIAGNGARAIYFNSSSRTSRLSRLSLGFGYWVHENVIFKAEYSKEDGRETTGAKRQDTDQIAAELGLRF